MTAHSTVVPSPAVRPSLPLEPRRAYCQLFQRGRCHYGHNCKYLHTARPSPSPRRGTPTPPPPPSKPISPPSSGVPITSPFPSSSSPDSISLCISSTPSFSTSPPTSNANTMPPSIPAVPARPSSSSTCSTSTATISINSSSSSSSSPSSSTTASPPPPLYPQRPEALDCQYYLKTGKCNYGARCKFNHPERQPALVSALNRRDCFDYVQNGTCPYGKTCKYNHPSSSSSLLRSSLPSSSSSLSSVTSINTTNPTIANAALSESSLTYNNNNNSTTITTPQTAPVLLTTALHNAALSDAPSDPHVSHDRSLHHFPTLPSPHPHPMRSRPTPSSHANHHHMRHSHHPHHSDHISPTNISSIIPTTIPISSSSARVPPSRGEPARKFRRAPQRVAPSHLSVPSTSSSSRPLRPSVVSSSSAMLLRTASSYSSSFPSFRDTLNSHSLSSYVHPSASSSSTNVPPVSTFADMSATSSGCTHVGASTASTKTTTKPGAATLFWTEVMTAGLPGSVRPTGTGIPGNGRKGVVDGSHYIPQCTAESAEGLSELGASCSSMPMSDGAGGMGGTLELWSGLGLGMHVPKAELLEDEAVQEEAEIGDGDRVTSGELWDGERGDIATRRWADAFSFPVLGDLPSLDQYVNETMGREVEGAMVMRTGGVGVEMGRIENGGRDGGFDPMGYSGMFFSREKKGRLGTGVWKPTDKSSLFGPGLFSMEH